MTWQGALRSELWAGLLVWAVLGWARLLCRRLLGWACAVPTAAGLGSAAVPTAALAAGSQVLKNWRATWPFGGSQKWDRPVGTKNRQFFE